MGKVKRVRKKYHQLIKADNARKANAGESFDYQEIVAGNFDKIKVPSVSTRSVDNNIFAGLNINVANLNTRLVNEDDRASVRSIAKSLKYDANGKLLKKVEKRKLRHELLMQRLNCFKRIKDEEKSRKKKKKNSGKPTDVTINTYDELPELISIENKEKIRIIKKRSIEKTKIRHKNMLDDISAFKKLLQDSKFNPLELVSQSVKSKLLSQETNKRK